MLTTPSRRLLPVPFVLTTNRSVKNQMAACTAAPLALLLLGTSGGPGAVVFGWGGTKIRSLDPPRISDAASEDVGGRDQVLSNETTFTRWAYVERIASIYRAPSLSSPREARLTWYTPDGFPSVYLLLRSQSDAQGQEWMQLRIPGRPNGRTGWVERDALGPFHLTHLLLVVNRERLRMYFWLAEHLKLGTPVRVI